MARRGGLGRGLTALIPSTDENDSTDTSLGLREIPIDSIEPNPLQPRQYFDTESLQGLVESVRELGILQPVLVRNTDRGFELIAGERRWRAAQRAGLVTIPAIIRSIENVHSLEQALVENLHRQDLNALEEASAYQQLMDDFDLTQDQVSKRVGKSRSTIANMLRLFHLPPSVQKLVGEGLVSTGHAKALLGHPDRAYQEGLARRIVAESLSVREVEQLVRERLDLESGLGAAGGSAEDDEHQSPDPEPDRDSNKAKLRPPGLLELEELLASHLDTRVGIAMSAKHGKVTIDFANLEDLERIYRLMMG